MEIYEFCGQRLGQYIKNVWGKGLLEGLEEIRFRDMRPILLKIRSSKYVLNEKGSITELSAYMQRWTRNNNVLVNDKGDEKAVMCNSSDIRQALDIMSHYSLYAFNEEIKNGFITLTGGHRVGICGQAVIEEGKLKTIKNISFLNFRVAGEQKGIGEKIYGKLFEDERFMNTLIISPPGYGKTTLLRDIVRIVSDLGHNIALIDERCEIAACYRGVPQNDVGMCTDVFDMMPKGVGIMTALRAMTPEIIAVDEINTDEDMKAVRKASNCGIALICTIHSDDIPENKEIKEIFKRFIRITKERNYIISDKFSGGNRDGN